MKNLVLNTFLVLSLSLVTTFSHGLTFTLTEKQINSMLVLGFPIKQSYQGVEATFLNPRIALDVLDKEIEISADIHAVKNGQKLKAKGTLVGQFHYDKIGRTLQFKRPSLDEFEVLENSIPEADEPIRIIRQTIGRNLPAIILIDLNKLGIIAPGAEPKNIEVVPDGLQITL